VTTEAGFSLLLCECDHAFVCSNKQGTFWECPACGNEENDVECLLSDVPGPERKVGLSEFNRMCAPQPDVLVSVRAALVVHDQAYRDRKHGGVADGAFVDTVRELLNAPPWEENGKP
jgi:hypothetical protein